MLNNIQFLGPLNLTIWFLTSCVWLGLAATGDCGGGEVYLEQGKRPKIQRIGIEKETRIKLREKLPF